MVTQPEVKVRCSQCHGCVSYREPSPLLCSLPINVICMFGSKSRSSFFSAYSTTHSTWALPASVPSISHLDLSLSFTVTGFFLPYTEVLAAALSLDWAEQMECSLSEIASRLLWRAQDLLLCSASLGRRPSVLWHPEYHQSQTSALSNFEDLGDFFFFWWVSSYLVRHINHLAYNDIHMIFQMLAFESFCGLADHVFKSRLLFSELFCTTVYMVHIVILYHTVSRIETTPFLENPNKIGNCLVEEQETFFNSLPTPAS